MKSLFRNPPVAPKISLGWSGYWDCGWALLPIVKVSVLLSVLPLYPEVTTKNCNWGTEKNEKLYEIENTVKDSNHLEKKKGFCFG